MLVVVLWFTVVGVYVCCRYCFRCVLFVGVVDCVSFVGCCALVLALLCSMVVDCA